MKERIYCFNDLSEAEVAVHWYRTNGQCLEHFGDFARCWLCNRRETLCDITKDPDKKRLSIATKYINKHPELVLELLISEED